MLKKMFLCILPVIFMINIVSCAPVNPAGKPNEKGVISVSGAFAIYPLMQRWSEAYHQINPGIEFDISTGGAGKGMVDTLAGNAEIGMISREISSDETARGAYPVAIARDAVFLTISAKNPIAGDLVKRGLKQAEIKDLFINEKYKTWGELIGRMDISTPIHLYTRSDASGAADTLAAYLGKKQENLKGIGVSGDPGILNAVVNDPLGIGYNNLGYAFNLSSGNPAGGILIVPIDKNENGAADPAELIHSAKEADNAVTSGAYPAPPARLLYLVTRGKPDGPVKDFLQWILTDGQKYVAETGFIRISDDELKKNLEKIN